MGVGTVIVILVLAWLLMGIGYWSVFLALGFRFQVAEEGLWRSPGTPDGLPVLQAQGGRSIPTSKGLPRNRPALVEHLRAEATPSLVFRPDGREFYRTPQR